MGGKVTIHELLIQWAKVHKLAFLIMRQVDNGVLS